MGLHRTVRNIKEKLKLAEISRADFNNLALMSYDIKELRTVEKYHQNDFYYNAYILKKYCEYDIKKPLACTTEHIGIALDSYIWELDVNDNIPLIVTMSDFRKDVISNKVSVPVYSIGPYIAYAEPFLSENKFKYYKNKLGKCLTVFPTHSTHWVDVSYDTEAFCKKIKEIKNAYSFDSVRICLYWKDIINGFHKIYQDNGFKCVSAGHIYEKNFLPRLKSIIELSDVTMSNAYGTHVAYSFCLNKPHFLFKQEYNHKVHKRDDQMKEIKRSVIQENNILFENLFGIYKEKITKEQKTFAEKFFSPQNTKTKEELYNIFTQAENKDE